MAEETPEETTRGLDLPIAENSWGFKGKNYLFLIGIDEYQYWPKLHCAVKDINDFADILTTRYQFDKSHMVFLKNESATERNILNGFTKLKKDITEEDNLIIYFSGHGQLISETGYWIPVDAHLEEEYEDEFINTAVIVDKLRAINSLHTFLIIDSCFSGALFGKIKAAPRSERYKSRRILSSGRAQEVVRDGPPGGNSPFAKAILRELKENTNRYFTASKLITDVTSKVEHETQQSPTDARLINASDDGGDFVFHLKVAEAELWGGVFEKHKKDLYQKFIEQFPESVHVPEAQEAIEWLGALEQNSKQAITAYLKKSQNKGKFVPLALKTLDALEDEECWGKAVKKNTLGAYFDYLARFDPGKYSEQANEKINHLSSDDEDKAFKKALEQGTPEALENYLKEPGEKKYAEEAKMKIETKGLATDFEALHEKAWHDAQAKNSYTGYKDFRQAYPDSKFGTIAEEKMIYLDKVVWNDIKMMEYDESKSPTEKIKRCIDYFHSFPGAPNNTSVKRMKDKIEIQRISDQ